MLVAWRGGSYQRQNPHVSPDGICQNQPRCESQVQHHKQLRNNRNNLIRSCNNARLCSWFAFITSNREWINRAQSDGIVNLGFCFVHLHCFSTKGNPRRTMKQERNNLLVEMTDGGVGVCPVGSGLNVKVWSSVWPLTDTLTPWETGRETLEWDRGRSRVRV